MEKTYEKEYVEKKLIAYIGNKRKLIPLIFKAINEVKKRGSVPINSKGWFIDYFSGTGVVARLAKSMGFKVIANDWEEYSYIFNKGFLENSEEDLKLFEEEGGLEKVIAELNQLTTYRGDRAYLSRYYCPKKDKEANGNRERLFYTRKNGIIIDNIREEIDKRYPLAKKDSLKVCSYQELRKVKKRNLLLALLLYESSKRSNTSGVFKAFHNGFGGKNRDALSRILGQVSLSLPTLSKSDSLSRVYNLDAIKLAGKLKNQKAEVVYLDPPYNQHQYGSNYHLLNTITLNDKPLVNKKFIINGKKVDKGAIRKDWTKTKSLYCYKKSAKDNFQSLIEKINSKYILISYSTEGIIDFEDMLTILGNKGKLAIVTTSYTRYRGGRQANHTQKNNIEFVIIVDTSLKNQKSDIENIKGILNYNKISNLISDFVPVDTYTNIKDRIEIKKKDKLEIYFKMFDLTFTLDEKLKLPLHFLDSLKAYSFYEQQEIIDDLQLLFKQNNEEKVRSIMNFFKDNYPIDKKYFSKELLRLFNKTKKDEVAHLDLKQKLFSFIDSRVNKEQHLEKILSFI